MQKWSKLHFCIKNVHFLTEFSPPFSFLEKEAQLIQGNETSELFIELQIDRHYAVSIVSRLRQVVTAG